MGQKVAEKPKIVTLCGSPRCVDIMAVSPYALFLRRLQTFGQGPRLTALTDACGVQLLLFEASGVREVGAREVGVRELGVRQVGVRAASVCEVGASASGSQQNQGRKQNQQSGHGVNPSENRDGPTRNQNQPPEGVMTPEDRAPKAVDNLLRVDALGSADHRAEIEAEIARQIREVSE